jgi:hypothetical protein
MPYLCLFISPIHRYTEEAERESFKAKAALIKTVFAVVHRGRPIDDAQVSFG